jgi:thiol-disulfide isomerase/thioredoxin
MKKLLIIFLGILLSVSCKESLPVNFWISGAIEGAVGDSIFVEIGSEQGMIQVISGVVGENGKFNMEGNIKGLGLYQIRLGNNHRNAIPITPMPNDKIVINSKKQGFTTSPGLSGTIWCEPINAYLEQMKGFKIAQDSLVKRQGSLSEEEYYTILLKNKKPLTDFVIDRITKNSKNPANLLLVMELFPMTGFEGWNPAFLGVFKDVLAAFNTTYGDCPATKALNTQYSQLEMGYRQFEQIEKGEIPAPNFALNDMSGKRVQLTDFRGKLVLIDFWASWCRPCRQESPNLVRIYNKFKGKNFTILSVSLDEDASKWKAAIAQDGLVWKNHVSDLRGWNSGMPGLYGFDGIPFTVLVNPEGRIIGKGLRGQSLENKIDNYYKTKP